MSKFLLSSALVAAVPVIDAVKVTRTSQTTWTVTTDPDLDSALAAVGDIAALKLPQHLEGGRLLPHAVRSHGQTCPCN